MGLGYGVAHREALDRGARVVAVGRAAAGHGAPNRGQELSPRGRTARRSKPSLGVASLRLDTDRQKGHNGECEGSEDEARQERSHERASLPPYLTRR